ncbi:hypothetical protein KAH55_07210 [bacterium]|nr:hypothetical protein [bacterium]
MGMVDLVAGIRVWHGRPLNTLPQPNKSSETGVDYSTYFNSLSDEFKNEVIKRTEYLV